MKNIRFNPIIGLGEILTMITVIGATAYYAITSHETILLHEKRLTKIEEVTIPAMIAVDTQTSITLAKIQAMQEQINRK